MSARHGEAPATAVNRDEGQSRITDKTNRNIKFAVSASGPMDNVVRYAAGTTTAMTVDASERFVAHVRRLNRPDLRGQYAPIIGWATIVEHGPGDDCSGECDDTNECRTHPVILWENTSQSAHELMSVEGLWVDVVPASEMDLS